MNRRDFIKAAVPVAVVPAIVCGGDKKNKEQTFVDLPHENQCNWDYRVYCYERQQGEWIFSENIRGSFAPEREYMSFEEENDLTWNGYCGWMDGGKLHFTSLEEAQDFVEMHARAKDDTNLIDSIYDIYYISRYDEGEGGVEIKVAHYWFNGDTGRQITWAAEKPYTDYTNIECA